MFNNEGLKFELTDLHKLCKSMNFRIKSRIAKQLFTIFSLIGITILSIVLPGCQQEEIFFEEPYLDLNLSRAKELTASEIEIYVQARERIDKYVKIKDGKFNLEINSSQMVNISEELFNHFKLTIEQANRMIIQKEIFVTNNGLSFKKDILFVRLKSGGVEEYDTDGSGLKWWGYSINISHSDYVAILAGTASLAAWIPNETASKLVATVMGLGYATYEAFGNGQGITYNITWAGFGWSSYN
jgi:hypothetical protein